MFVRELTDGQEIDQVLLVREGERAARRRPRVPAARPRRPHGHRHGDGLGGRRRAGGLLRAPARRVRVTGRYGVHPRHGAELTVSALRPAERSRVRARRAARRAAARRATQHGGRPARARRHRPAIRTCARCSTAMLGPGSPTWARFRDAPAAKRYHQAYRHGLLEHCLGVAQAGRRDLGDVPGHRPRRRGDRRAAARHRQARRLHGRPAGDRHDRPRQAPGRDPARLLPGAPHDRGPARLPRGARGGRPAHHPVPPRLSSSTARRSCPARARRRSCT